MQSIRNTASAVFDPLRDAASTVAYPLTRSAQWGVHAVQAYARPEEVPAKALTRIGSAASDALKQIPVAPTPPPQPILAPASQPAALPIPNRAAATRDRILKEQCPELARKLTTFTTLIYMQWYGTGKADDRPQLMSLANQVVTENKSPWRLLIDYYEKKGESLSFLGKCQAALVYLLMYLLPFLSNTIDTYVKGFVEGLIDEFQGGEAGNPRPARPIFEKLVDQIDKFLEKDLHAAEKVARGEAVDLAALRLDAIRAVYGHDEKQLCQDLSDKMIASTTSDSWVSRWIVAPIVGYFLPSILETGLKQGISLAQPTYTPFNIAITRYLKEKIIGLAATLDAPIDPNAPVPPPLAGEQLLKGTINKLRSVLAYEQIANNPQKMREVYADQHYQRSIDLDGVVNDSIEDAIRDGAQALFQYLKSQAETGELFSNLVDVCNQSFAGRIKTQDELDKEQAEEIARLNSEVYKIILKLVTWGGEEAIGELFDGAIRGTTYKAQDFGKRVFTGMGAHLKTLHATLQSNRDTMGNKLAAQGRSHPDLMPELAVSFSKLEQFAAIYRDAKEGINLPVPQMGWADQNAMWRAMNRELTQVEELVEKYYNPLLAAQEQYTAYKIAHEECDEIVRLSAQPLTPTIIEKIEDRAKHITTTLQQAKILTPVITQFIPLVEKLKLLEKLTAQRASLLSLPGELQAGTSYEEIERILEPLSLPKRAEFLRLRGKGKLSHRPAQLSLRIAQETAAIQQEFDNTYPTTNLHLQNQIGLLKDFAQIFGQEMQTMHAQMKRISEDLTIALSHMDQTRTTAAYPIPDPLSEGQALAISAAFSGITALTAVACGASSQGAVAAGTAAATLSRLYFTPPQVQQKGDVTTQAKAGAPSILVPAATLAVSLAAPSVATGYLVQSASPFVTAAASAAAGPFIARHFQRQLIHHTTHSLILPITLKLIENGKKLILEGRESGRVYQAAMTRGYLTLAGRQPS